jgi:hypothetical protein
MASLPRGCPWISTRDRVRGGGALLSRGGGKALVGDGGGNPNAPPQAYAELADNLSKLARYERRALAQTRPGALTE